MDGSKIHLSATEEKLMLDANIILTKNVVLQKMKSLLENVQLQQLLFIRENGWDKNAIFMTAPKISKGENYMGLPYLILDFPRCSCKEDFIFIRTFFWWGHFFSSTLQVTGKSKALTISNLEKNWNRLAEKEYYLGIHDDPWVHHFETSNYQLLKTIDVDQWQQKKQELEFVKIAAKWPLADWPDASSFLFNSWTELVTNLIGTK